MKLFVFVNNVIIASKICNCLKVDASASAQNQKLKYEVLNYKAITTFRNRNFKL